jgi:hypothetical protein
MGSVCLFIFRFTIDNKNKGTIQYAANCEFSQLQFRGRDTL